MARKTYPIFDLVKSINEKTRQSYEDEKLAKETGGKILPYMTAEYRGIIQSVVSEILHETGNYNGFTELEGWETDHTLQQFYYPR